MKDIFISTYDIYGGAARAAYRLHKGLQSIGVDSKMLVQQKMSDDHSVSDPPPIWRKGLGIVSPFLDNRPLLFYPKREKVIFSTAFLPDEVSARVGEFEPDIIHLHWVANGFLRIENLRRFKRPIVWTLHDMWAFTGGCHYDGGCGRYKEKCGSCPLLGSGKQKDLSRRVWERKEKAWQGLDITVVAPSRWLADCARASSIFRGNRVEEIPYGLDTTIYKPAEKRKVREIWNLPKDKKLILFGAMGASSDRRKGFQYLEPALNKIAENSKDVELVVFGSTEPANPPDFGLKVHYVGRLHDDVSLVLLYSAADVFIAPSVEDNLPNTVMESLACGTPVVAFNIGGMPDMIEHERNGYLARPFETDDLTNGIKWVLDDPETAGKLSAAAREKAVREYNLELQARRYLNLYEEILGSR